MKPKVLGLILCQNGFKGIPGKNMREVLAGKPLIQYTIESAQQSDLLHTLTVTTDGPETIRFCATILSRLYSPSFSSPRLNLAGGADNTPMTDVVRPCY